MTIPADILRAVSCSMSRKVERYVLCGVQVTPKKDGVVLCATNGCVLIAAYVEGSHDFDSSFIIPAKLIAYLGRSRAPVTLTFRDGCVHLALDGVTFSSKPVDGNYPNWKTVVKIQGELTRAMPSGISQKVTDILYGSLRALGKSTEITDVHRDGQNEMGAHYLSLSKDVFACFMPVRSGFGGEAQKFVLPEWVDY